MIRVSNY